MTNQELLQRIAVLHTNIAVNYAKLNDLVKFEDMLSVDGKETLRDQIMTVIQSIISEMKILEIELEEEE